MMGVGCHDSDWGCGGLFLVIADLFFGFFFFFIYLFFLFFMLVSILLLNGVDSQLSVLLDLIPYQIWL